MWVRRLLPFIDKSLHTQRDSAREHDTYMHIYIHECTHMGEEFIALHTQALVHLEGECARP